ncbi:unnamed protein product [Amoebophrya sp. A120]|nr:unnamed protein product [Amoebophrya sp. A120]|eukprot:GSA120T00014118001.1
MPKSVTTSFNICGAAPAPVLQRSFIFRSAGHYSRPRLFSLSIYFLAFSSVAEGLSSSFDFKLHKKYVGSSTTTRAFLFLLQLHATTIPSCAAFWTTNPSTRPEDEQHHGTPSSTRSKKVKRDRFKFLAPNEPVEEEEEPGIPSTSLLEKQAKNTNTNVENPQGLSSSNTDSMTGSSGAQEELQALASHHTTHSHSEGERPRPPAVGTTGGAGDHEGRDTTTSSDKQKRLQKNRDDVEVDHLSSQSSTTSSTPALNIAASFLESVLQALQPPEWMLLRDPSQVIYYDGSSATAQSGSSHQGRKMDVRAGGEVVDHAPLGASSTPSGSRPTGSDLQAHDLPAGSGGDDAFTGRVDFLQQDAATSGKSTSSAGNHDNSFLEKTDGDLRDEVENVEGPLSSAVLSSKKSTSSSSTPPLAIAPQPPGAGAQVGEEEATAAASTKTLGLVEDVVSTSEERISSSVLEKQDHLAGKTEDDDGETNSLKNNPHTTEHLPVLEDNYYPGAAKTTGSSSSGSSSRSAGGIEKAGNNKLPDEKEDLLVPEDLRGRPSSRVEESFLEAAAAGDGAGDLHTSTGRTSKATGPPRGMKKNGDRTTEDTLLSGRKNGKNDDHDTTSTTYSVSAPEEDHLRSAPGRRSSSRRTVFEPSVSADQAQSSMLLTKPSEEKSKSEHGKAKKNAPSVSCVDF